MAGGRPGSHLLSVLFFLTHALPSPNGSERKLIMLLQVSVLYFLYFTITNVPPRPDRGIDYELFGLQIKSILIIYLSPLRGEWGHQSVSSNKKLDVYPPPLLPSMPCLEPEMFTVLVDRSWSCLIWPSSSAFAFGCPC